jgi:hypothetical protein
VSLFLLALSLAGCGAMTNSAQGQVVGEFMTAMFNKDVAAAVALFPTGSEAEMTPQLEGLLADQFYLFEGYQSITVTSISTNAGADQTTAELEGMVAYEDDFEGVFQAALLKEGDAWKLTNITVNVSEEKVP